jgi:hypothetical protein
VPDGKPFMSLITVDKGAVRMILVARPEGGLASWPDHDSFKSPASAPLGLRRVAAQTSQLGYVHPGSQDYDRYLGELARVTPQFGGFTDVRAPSTHEHNARRCCSIGSCRRLNEAQSGSAATSAGNR